MGSIHSLAEEFNFKSKNNPKFIILLVHGFTASPSEVKPLGKFVYKYFKSEVTVTSILLPGHGISGENGYKELDKIHYEDWITAVHERIDQLIRENKDTPIFLAGLSMGSALIGEYLSNSVNTRILGGILLSPPLFIQGKIFLFVGILKYFIKYQAKDQETFDYFKKKNLFSYHIRSVRGVDEFRKLINKTRKN